MHAEFSATQSDTHTRANTLGRVGHPKTLVAKPARLILHLGTTRWTSSYTKVLLSLLLLLLPLLCFAGGGVKNGAPDGKGARTERVPGHFLSVFTVPRTLSVRLGSPDRGTFPHWNQTLCRHCQIVEKVAEKI